MHAFEAGTITEDMFGTRVRDLGNKARALQARHEELSEAVEEADLTPPTAADIEALRQELEDEIENGSDPRKKAIAHAFVKELVVEERDTIQPCFYIRGGIPDLDPQPPDTPDGNDETPSDEKGFRAMTPTVEVKGLEPSASTLRMSGSQRFDQDLSEEIAGSGVAIPSGSLAIPPLPAR